MQNTAQDKKEIDHNQYWTIKNNPLSKVGVFPYLGRQISPELEPETIYNVYRSEKELFSPQTVESFKLEPIIDEHVMLGTKAGFTPAEEKGIHGVIGADVYGEDGTLYGDLRIFSEELKDKIENGKKELSLGYFCDYVLESGTYKGEHYDAIQTNIKGNHVALVDEGRMGSDVRVYDHQVTFDTIQEIKQMAKIKAAKKTKKTAMDANVDNDKIMDEISGILKGKVDDELIKTVVQKVTELSAEKSESAATDDEELETVKEVEDEETETEAKDKEEITDEEETKNCAAKDEDETEVEDEETETEAKDEEEKTEISMDAMIKQIAIRDEIVEAVKPLIGNNTGYKRMTARQVARYACDRLDIKTKNPVSALKGYLAANKKQVAYSLDSKAKTLNPRIDTATAEYLK